MNNCPFSPFAVIYPLPADLASRILQYLSGSNKEIVKEADIY